MNDRFWAKVDRTGECWAWTGAQSDGYGSYWSAGKIHKAYRYSYETEVGPIPPGLDLDHLCRNHSCVRPSHLEPVTRRENLLRGNTIQARNAAKTHCPQGHAFDAENTALTPRGQRRCRACARVRDRQVRALKKEVANQNSGRS